MRSAYREAMSPAGRDKISQSPEEFDRYIQRTEGNLRSLERQIEEARKLVGPEAPSATGETQTTAEQIADIKKNIESNRKAFREANDPKSGMDPEMARRLRDRASANIERLTESLEKLEGPAPKSMSQNILDDLSRRIREENLSREFKTVNDLLNAIAAFDTLEELYEIGAVDRAAKKIDTSVDGADAWVFDADDIKQLKDLIDLADETGAPLKGVSFKAPNGTRVVAEDTDYGPQWVVRYPDGSEGPSIEREFRPNLGTIRPYLEPERTAPSTAREFKTVNDLLNEIAAFDTLEELIAYTDAVDRKAKKIDASSDELDGYVLDADDIKQLESLIDLADETGSPLKGVSFKAPNGTRVVAEDTDYGPEWVVRSPDGSKVTSIAREYRPNLGTIRPYLEPKAPAAASTRAPFEQIDTGSFDTAISDLYDVGTIAANGGLVNGRIDPGQDIIDLSEQDLKSLQKLVDYVDPNTGIKIGTEIRRSDGYTAALVEYQGPKWLINDEYGNVIGSLIDATDDQRTVIDQINRNIENAKNAPVETGDFDDEVDDADVDTFDEAAFDSMFAAPPGTTKPDIFGVYRPKGRTVQTSEDYTDDPEILANKFHPVRLVTAAADAIEDGVDEGELPFSDGSELVPVVALLEAVEKAGLDKGVILAGIYENIAQQQGNDKVKQEAQQAYRDLINYEYDQGIGVGAQTPGEQRRKILRAKLSTSQAVLLNGLLGEPGRTTNAYNLITAHDERNPQILKLARDIENAEEMSDGLRSPEFDTREAQLRHAADIAMKMLPLALSEDKQDNEAFAAYWGILQMTDGGDSLMWHMGGDNELNFWRAVANAYAESLGGDLESDGGPALDDLYAKYGDFKEFAAGRQTISDGIEDLSSGSTTAALYRFVAEAAVPNTTRLDRRIIVDSNSQSFAESTTPGSIIDIDPRSFTARDLEKDFYETSENHREMFTSRGDDLRAVIYRVRPGDIRSVDVHNYSWIPNELEHIGFGRFKVENVTKAGEKTYFVDLIAADDLEKDVTPGQQAQPAYDDLMYRPLMPDTPEYDDALREARRARESGDPRYKFDENGLIVGKTLQFISKYDDPMSPDYIGDQFGGPPKGSDQMMPMYYQKPIPGTRVYEIAKEEADLARRSGDPRYTYGEDGLITGKAMNYISRYDDPMSPDYIGDQFGGPPKGADPFVLYQATTAYHGNISDWKKVGGRAGSNEGGVYQDENGNRFYVKKSRSQSHAENEALASAFYRFFGLRASDVGLGTMDDAMSPSRGTYDPTSGSFGSDYIITPMIPNATNLEENLDDNSVIEQLHGGFAIDAWLSNYDVIGLVHDNVVVDGDNNAHRIDPGGALMWRAQGKKKDWFGPEVKELDSMRDPDINQSAFDVFGGMTNAQIVESAKRLLDISPSQIDNMVDAVISNRSDAEMLKDILKRRRSSILDQLGIKETSVDPFADKVPLTESIGYEAQDLQPGDVIGDDSFVIERIFRDGDTPSGKVSVQGYFPGHESQRKEWNETTIIPAARGGTIPPKGDKPALHRPRAPRKPAPGAFSGEMADRLKDAKTWEEAAAIIRSTPIIFFDYETTGLPGPDKGGLNRPVQIGAVKVVDGKVVDRFSMYMNPEHELSDWSAAGLKQMDGTPVTEEWLATQASMREAHEAFLAFAGENPILGGHYTPFDLEILNRTIREQGLPQLNIAGVIDSMDLAGGTLPKWNSKTLFGAFKIGKDGKRRATTSLGPVADFLQVQLPDWHRADADAEASWEITDAMLDRAIENPDTTPTTLLNVDGAFEAKQQALAKYEEEYAKYEADLAEYVAAKAIAAAWNCGGSGITAAVGPAEGPCSVPDVERMVREATPMPIGDIDPDGVEGGSTANPSSMTDAQEIDDPKHDGVDTNDPYKDEPFMPTEEQRAILDAIMTGDDVVVEALAGTGKTSTLLLAGKRKKKERPNERGVYIAFNKSAQLEAEEKFAKAGLTNIEVVTNDAIAYRWAPDDIKKKMSRLDKSNPLAYYKNFASAFGITEMSGPEGNMSLFEATTFFKSVVDKFLISADDEIGPQHFIAAGWSGNVPDWMMSIANNIWNDYTNPDGRAKISNSVITKMWALSRPDLSKIGAGTKYGNDFIFFDEAQDINPVSGKVIADQSAQVVYVGDENQAIYGFRGGENQLAKVDKSVKRLPLTKSFRFGANVAKEADKWLKLLGSDLRVIGAGSDEGELLRPGSLDDTADAILVRTNGGGFSAIADQLSRGRTVGVTKNYRGDLVSLTDTAEYLITGNNRPSKLHPDLAPFKTWAEVKKAIQDELVTSKKLETFVQMVDRDGIAGMREMIDKLKLVKGSGEIRDMSESDTQADVGDVSPGASGELGKGVKYTVTGAVVSLTGNTYANKEAIKSVGKFKYNPPTKSWDAPRTGDEDTFELLNQLSSALGLKPAGAAPEADGPIDVFVTTVHQAKGLEWDKVKIWDDFWGPRVNKATGDLEMPDPTEYKIAYVAVTRAKKKLEVGPLDWVNGFVKPDAPAEEEVSVPTPEPTAEGEGGGGVEVPPAPTPTPAEGGDDNERIIKSVKSAVKAAEKTLDDYADRGSKDEKNINKFRNAVKDALYAYDGELYVDAEEKFREAAELLEPYAEVGAEELQSLMLQAADAADAIRISKTAPKAEKPAAPEAAPTKALDPEWRPDDVAAPQGPMPTGVAEAPDDVLPDADAPKTAQQAAEEKNKAFRSNANKSADLQRKFDELDEAVEIVTGEDSSLKTSDRKRVRAAAEKINDIRKALANGSISEAQALAQLNEIADTFPHLPATSATSIDINFFRDMIDGIREVLTGEYYWRPTGNGLPPLDAVDSTGRPVGYSKDGKTFITPGMRVRDKWGYSGTVEGYNEKDWINVYIRYDIDPRDPASVKKGNWGPGVARKSMNPSTLTVLSPEDDTDPWIDLPSTPASKKLPQDIVDKQKKDWAKLKAAREYEAAARAAELAGEPVPPMPPGLALMKPSADLVRESKKTKANISSYFDDSNDDIDIADSTNDFSLSKDKKIVASDAVLITYDDNGNPMVLMITRGYGPFKKAHSLPGGFRNENESFEAAADREMMEEVNISADQATSRRYLGEVDANDWDPRAYKGAYVGAVAYEVPKDTPLKAGDDATGAEWVSVQDIIKGTTPIAFGHATWLAEAFKGTKYEAPLRALVRASKERNARLINQINEIRAQKGFPMFDTPSLEVWTPVYPGGDGEAQEPTPEPGGPELPKAEAPSGAPVFEAQDGEKRAADVGDEVANPSSEQNALANRVPPKEILLELIKTGSTDKDARLNESWARHMAQYDGNGPGADVLRKVTNYLGSLGAGITFHDEQNDLTLRNSDMLDELLELGLVYEVDPKAKDEHIRYRAVPELAHTIHGILAFTSDSYATDTTSGGIKNIINKMKEFEIPDQESFTNFGPAKTVPLPKNERFTVDFWERVAMILNNPNILDDVEDKDYADIATGPAGMFMRALREAGELEGSFTRVLSFKMPIEDPSHPLNYLLQDGAYITIRPSSWAPDDDPDQELDTLSDLEDRGLFRYGAFGQGIGAGDVMITVNNPKGLDARATPNDFEESEVILANGRYRVQKIEKKEVDGNEYTHFTIEKEEEPPAPSGAPATDEELAGELGDEISAPDDARNEVLNNAPDDEILLRLLTEGGSSDKNVKFNESWADYIASYQNDGPAAWYFKLIADTLSSFDGERIDFDDEAVVQDLISKKMLVVEDPEAENVTDKYLAPGLGQLAWGIHVWTDGAVLNKDPQEAIQDMKERLIVDTGDNGYVSPAWFSAPVEMKTVAEFWTAYAKILDDPSLIQTDPRIGGSPAGMLMRTLREAGTLNGTFARVLSFKQSIDDESHPLNYMLNVGQPVTLRPASWAQYSGEITSPYDVFGYEGWGQDPDNLGDVLITVENPKGLDARPLANSFEENEFILTNGRYVVKSVERKELNGVPYTHFTLEHEDGDSQMPASEGAPAVPQTDSRRKISEAYASSKYTREDSGLEAEGLIDYITYGTGDVNGLLRANSRGDEDWEPDAYDRETIEDYVTQIDAIMDGAPTLDVPVTVFRGTYVATEEIPSVGDTYDVQTYSSTSLSPDVANDFLRPDRHFSKFDIEQGYDKNFTPVIYEIELPAGEKFLSVADFLPGIDAELAKDKEYADKDWKVEGIDGQQEILLKHGMKLEVTDVIKKDDGSVVIKVRPTQAKAKAKTKAKTPSVERTPEQAQAIMGDSRWEAATPVDNPEEFVKDLTEKYLDAQGEFAKFHETASANIAEFSIGGAYEYFDLGSHDYNRYLAGITTDTKYLDDADYDKAIKTFDALIDAAPRIDKDIVVFRGVGGSAHEFGDVLAPLEVGDEFTNPAYTSTSLDIAIAEDFMSLDLDVLPKGKQTYFVEIVVPAGTKAISGDAMRDPKYSTPKYLEYDEDGELVRSEELEFILPRNMSFRVLSKEGNRIKLLAIGDALLAPTSTSIPLLESQALSSPESHPFFPEGGYEFMTAAELMGTPAEIMDVDSLSVEHSPLADQSDNKKVKELAQQVAETSSAFSSSGYVSSAVQVFRDMNGSMYISPGDIATVLAASTIGPGTIVPVSVVDKPSYDFSESYANPSKKATQASKILEDLLSPVPGASVVQLKVAVEEGSNKVENSAIFARPSSGGYTVYALVKINDFVQLPFYIRSQEADGITPNRWYPAFGIHPSSGSPVIGDADAVDGYYGDKSGILEQISELLNTALPDALDRVSYDIPVASVGGAYYDPARDIWEELLKKVNNTANSGGIPTMLAARIDDQTTHGVVRLLGNDSSKFDNSEYESFDIDDPKTWPDLFADTGIDITYTQFLNYATQAFDVAIASPDEASFKKLGEFLGVLLNVGRRSNLARPELYDRPGGGSVSLDDSLRALERNSGRDTDKVDEKYKDFYNAAIFLSKLEFMQQALESTGATPSFLAEQITRVHFDAFQLPISEEPLTRGPADSSMIMSKYRLLRSLQDFALMNMVFKKSIKDALARGVGLNRPGDPLVSPAGRPVHRPDAPVPLTKRAVDNVPSLMEAIDEVRANTPTKESPAIMRSALVDSDSIEDLDVSATQVYIESAGEDMLQLRFKLTPWAMLAMLNKIQTDSPFDESDVTKDPNWDGTSHRGEMWFPLLDKKTGKLVIKEMPTQDFYNGSTYIYDDGTVRIVLTSAQSQKGSIEILDDSNDGAPAAYHGQVIIHMPIDSDEQEIANALRTAGVVDPRGATQKDIDIVSENKLLSLLQHLNDPSKNEMAQAVRDNLLFRTKNEYGVGPEDIRVVVGNSGRLNYILPIKAAEALQEIGEVNSFHHSLSLGSAIREAKRAWELLVAERRQNASQPGSPMATFYEPNWGDAIPPRQFVLDFVLDQLYNFVTRGALSTVERKSQGRRDVGMSSSDDELTGGADYVFFTPKDNHLDELPDGFGFYTASLGSATLVVSPENILTRADLYGNESDLFGKRIPGSRIFDGISPGANETVVRGGIESIAKGNTLYLTRVLHDKLLEMLKENGITEINGVPVTDAIEMHTNQQGVRSIELENNKKLIDRITELGGNADALTLGDVQALTYVAGAPFVYPWLEPSARVLLAKYTTGEDDEFGLEAPTLFVQTTDDGRVYMLVPSDGRDNPENPFEIVDKFFVGLLDQISRDQSEEGRKYPFIGKSTGKSLSNVSTGKATDQAFVPAGQSAGAGFLAADAPSDASPQSYVDYIEKILQGIRASTTKSMAIREYAIEYNKLFALYMSDIGGIMVDGVSLRSKVADAIFAARNLILGLDRDTPLTSSAENKQSIFSSYDELMMTGSIVSVFGEQVVLEPLDGPLAGRVRNVYRVSPEVALDKDGITIKRSGVSIETDNTGGGYFRLDEGTSLIVDHDRNEIRFKSKGRLYRIRARRDSDTPTSKKRA